MEKQLTEILMNRRVREGGNVVMPLGQKTGQNPAYFKGKSLGEPRWDADRVSREAK